MNQFIDEAEIRRALDLLKPNNEVFEIRIPTKNKSKTLSGYFDDADKAITALQQTNLSGNNVYINIQAANKDVKNRSQYNQLMQYVSTTSDSDIVRYSWFFIDLDPERMTGISATEEEVKEAYKVATKIYHFLAGIGFSEPIQAFSGNGIHLLYKINLDNNKENTDLIKHSLKTLSALFDTKEIKVDTSVFNPSRICKLYGTKAQKGSNTTERAHRMSKIYKIPEELEENPRELFNKIIAMLPSPESMKKDKSSYSASEFDLESFMLEHGLTYRNAITSAEYGTIYYLDNCPFDSSHDHGDARIFQFPNGKLGFKCWHNHCNTYGWKELRQLLDPDYNTESTYNTASATATIQTGIAKDLIELEDTPQEEIQPVKESLAEIQEYFKRCATDPIIKTGYKQLDNILGGGLLPGLYIVGAVSSLGKTTYCLQMADNIAKSGKDVFFFSIEMAKHELIARSISRLTYVLRHEANGALTASNVLRGQKFVKGDAVKVSFFQEYNRIEKEKLAEAWEYYANQIAEHLYIFEAKNTKEANVNYIKLKIAQHIANGGQPPIVFIDYLQLLNPGEMEHRNPSDKMKVDNIVTELRQLSNREYHIPIIAISSLNRDNYDAPMNASAYKESGNIEYSADVLIGLQLDGIDPAPNESATTRQSRIAQIKREQLRNKKAGKNMDLQVKVLKNRNGMTDDYTTNYRPIFNYFSEG